MQLMETDFHIADKKWWIADDWQDAVPEFATRRLTEQEEITVIFSYPLNKEVSRTFKNSGGFTLAEFCTVIADSYAEIYRDQPDNIWGHDIRDLVIEGFGVNQDGSYRLAIGS
jgi:hypothetical protein